MASNLARHTSNTIPQSKARAAPQSVAGVDNVSETKSGSILSDLQSLWVLFDPANTIRTHSSVAHESDILSFTNDTGSQITETDSDGTNSQYHGEQRQRDVEEDDDDDDSLIDNFESRDSTPSQSRLEQLFQLAPAQESGNLDNRINQWKQNDLDELIDDNVASWDLDENLISQILDTLLINKLKGKKIPPQDFYGDDFFANYLKSDYIKFKKISNNLKHNLSREASTNEKLISSTLPEIINQLLVKFLNQHDHSSHRQNNVDVMNQQRKRYSTILNQSTSTNHLISSIIENQLNPNTPLATSGFNSPMQNSQDPGSPGTLHLSHSLEFSDTATSSSLVLCGGMRVGGGNSWGDI